MAIVAIPVTDIPASDVSSPSNALTPTISNEDFTPPLTNSITIGVLPAVAGGALIPIIHHTGKVKDDESDSVAGRLHTISISCEIDERGGEVWAAKSALDPTPCCFALERTAHHLVLTFRDGARAFVSSTEDTYVCNIERDGSKVSVAFVIKDLMGVQMLV